MENNKTGKGRARDGGRGVVCCFVHGVREGLSNQVLLEPTPKGGEGASRVDIWGTQREQAWWEHSRTARRPAWLGQNWRGERGKAGSAIAGG